jgi:hypothetical protein
MKKITICLALLACLMSSVAYSSNTIEMPHIAIDTAKQDSLIFTEFAGKYAFTGLPFEVLEVTIKEAGKIHIEAGERIGDVAPLASDPDSFQTPEAVLKFVRDDYKKVIFLKLDAAGMTFEGKKMDK